MNILPLLDRPIAFQRSFIRLDIGVTAALFDAGIRRPFARIQEAESRLRESEGRLSLLGRNLPHSVLFQIVRELDGRVHFVHMGDAIERLNGVRVEDVLQDIDCYGAVCL